MKTNRLTFVLTLAIALCAVPVDAQIRGGGGSHSSSSRSSHSSSSSSSSNSSRGSSSHSYSSPSHSSSSSVRSSSPSRSSSSSSMRSSSSHSYNSPSRSSSPSVRSASPSSSSSSPRHSESSRPQRSVAPSTSSRGTINHGERALSISRPSSSAPRHTSARTAEGVKEARSTVSSHGTPNDEIRGRNNLRTNTGDALKAGGKGTPAEGVRSGNSTLRGAASDPVNRRNDGRFARPGERGPMPPSRRPMHPAPYFHHPYHHHMVHMHPIVWHHVPPRHVFWPGFWLYCDSYWYDYHVTNVTVVRNYIKDTYNLDMISYAMSGDIMYAIVHENGTYYLQVYDRNDKLLAEHEISRKYIKTEIDRENGGCWIFKKKDKDPMLFIYSDGELLIYEAD